MKGLLKYFGVVYVIIIIALVGIGIVYLNDLPNFKRQEVTGPVEIPRDSIEPPEADLPMVKGTISPPVDVFKLAVSTPEQVEKGKTLFSTTCISCHGAEGKGDGVAGASLNPKPRNFTSLDGWKNGPKFTQMYKTVQEGIPNSAMASFSNIPPEDRIAVIHYIQETFIKNYPKSTDDELKELDKTYSLSAGVKQPNQIPISLAMEKIISENAPTVKKVNTLNSVVEKSSNDTGAILFKQITNNSLKALTMLAADTSWQNNQAVLGSLILTDPVSNGFRGEAAVLSDKELSAIFRFLKSLFVSYKG